MTTVELFFCLIKSEITGEAVCFSDDFNFDFNSLMSLASHHKLAHLIADALNRNSLVPDDIESVEIIKKTLINEAFIFANNENACKSAEKIFNNNGIPYILLKGAVMRSVYPEKWMRTSCDTDILIHEEDLDKSIMLLKENGFTTNEKKGIHDVVLYLGKAILELHFSICENQENIDQLLNKAWDYAKSKGNGNEYELDADFFVFYLIAHMSHHFLNGGCGIKPFIDLWILKRNNLYNEEKVKKYCEQCSLLKFYNSSCSLISFWFENNKATDEIKLMEKFILKGGTYGSFKNSAAIETVKSQNRIRQIIKKIFIKKKTMEVLYPILKKHPVLLPFMYIKRVFESLSLKKIRTTNAKMKTIINNDNEYIDDVSTLIDIIGL